MKEYQEPQQSEQENDDEADKTAGEKQTDQIVETGSITGVKGKHIIHCLTIIGQIEGHYILPAQNKTTKYEHVIPQLVAIEQDPDIEGLVIILNTVGGDVEAGLAIAELIAGMKKPTVSLVLGGGHSIGVPLACSAKYSVIAPSATMTIHPVRMNGLVLGVPQTLSYFEKMQERIVRFVTQNSNIEADHFRDLMMTTGELVMDVGTVLDGEKAVSEGLIDELGGLERVIEKIYELIEERQANSEETKPDATHHEKSFRTSRVTADSVRELRRAPALAGRRQRLAAQRAVASSEASVLHRLSRDGVPRQKTSWAEQAAAAYQQQYKPGETYPACGHTEQKPMQLGGNPGLSATILSDGKRVAEAKRQKSIRPESDKGEKQR